MKYTPELTEKLKSLHASATPIPSIAEELGVSERSVIAKLSSLGLYKREGYRNKRGEIPIKKAQYVEMYSDLLGVDVELLESLEKVNKHVLKLIYDRLSE